MEKPKDIGQIADDFIEMLKKGHIDEDLAKYLADHRQKLAQDQKDIILTAADELFLRISKELKEDDYLVPLWYLKLAEK